MKNNLKLLRERSKKTQSTLASKVGISLTEVHAIESNEEDNILINNYDLQTKICKYLKCTKDELLNIDGYKEDVVKSITSRKVKKERYIFLDTSCIVKAYRDLRKYLQYFDKICIPKIVIHELNKLKDNKEDFTKFASALASIQQLHINEVILDFGNEVGSNNDEKIFNTAVNFSSKNPDAIVILLSIDSDFKFKKSDNHNFQNLNEEEYKKFIAKLDNKYNLELTDLFWNNLSNKNYNAIKKMELKEVDVNSIYKNNYTPLCYAIENNCSDIVNHMLYYCDIDLDVTGSNPNGYGALHCAVKNNDYDLVLRLIEKGCNINLLSKDVKLNNVTPLMVSCNYCYSKIMNLLIEKGASVNQQDSNGETALHRAAKKRNRQCYDKLIKYADENIIDNEYKTALYYMKKDLS